ncbi:hypothetical protein ACO22_01111 [Paracoccidioides brasiliensis]|uniref:Uncharacterized protein n=1 Tax=Paracoccidioides brasiliensis TaxID=121759 RepID=A0A1D2JMT5_PARBR|nr:hypothetical protein ACO22_01111 [Paracoccidioides brasiliensis]
MGRECSFFIPFQQGAGRPANRHASIAAFRDPDKLEFKPRVLFDAGTRNPYDVPQQVSVIPDWDIHDVGSMQPDSPAILIHDSAHWLSVDDLKQSLSKKDFPYEVNPLRRVNTTDAHDVAHATDTETKVDYRTLEPRDELVEQRFVNTILIRDLHDWQAYGDGLPGYLGRSVRDGSFVCLNTLPFTSTMVRTKRKRILGSSCKISTEIF